MPRNVYILYSAIRDRYYVGHTGDDLQERLRKHNSDHKGFIGKIGDWIIVYTKDLSNKNSSLSARTGNQNMKSRKKIELLIATHKED